MTAKFTVPMDVVRHHMDAIIRLQELQAHAHVVRMEALRDPIYREREKNNPDGTIDALYRLEMNQWHNLMMFGLCLEGEERDRIKAEVRQRFLGDVASVKEWLGDGSGAWLAADEDAFRDMVRKAFAPREEQNK